MLLLVVSKLITAALSYSSQLFRAFLIAKAMDCLDPLANFGTANNFSLSLYNKYTIYLLYLFRHVSVSGSSFHSSAQQHFPFPRNVMTGIYSA